MTVLILFWALYIAVPLLLWRGALRISRRPVAASTDFDASLCGRCGYEVRNLPSDICPECGSDLNVVGRSTSAQLWRRRLQRWLVPLSWVSMMLLLGAAFTIAALFSFSPRRQVGWLISPKVAFIGNAEAPWPFLMIIEVHWDRDESPHALGHWYPQRQAVGRLSSAARGPAFTPTNAKADSDQSLTWDSLHDSWVYQSPTHAVRSGRGFPPASMLRVWAEDVVGRRPPARPLTPTELSGLIVAGGDALGGSSPRTLGPQWQAERAALLSGGALAVTPVNIGGSFSNEIIPFWPPTAVVAFAWLAVIVFCWRALRQQRCRARSVLAQ